jgi:hypothetical protein
MNQHDYTQAWSLMASWRDAGSRERQLEALRASDRRPYVVIAMVRIASMLSKITSVTEGFADQLSQTPYSDMEEGILNITDQILIPASELPDADETDLERLVMTLARQEGS